MIKSNLWNFDSFRPDIDFLIGSNILEYDIEKCNIHILYNKNAIDIDTFNELYNAEKKYRTVYIGKFLRYQPEFNKVLLDGIAEARKKLFDILELENHDILTIRRDAIFIIDSNNYLINTPEIIINDGYKIPIKFRIKNRYSSFYNLKNKIELYYRNKFNNIDEILYVSGIGDEKVAFHENYLIDFFKTIFQIAESGNIIEVLNILKSFYMNYINLKLDTGYYREFNSSSYFRLNKFSEFYSNICLMGISNEQLQYADISYNESILRLLYSIFSSIYFNKN